MKNKTDYNQVVNFEDGIITVLDYTFDYKDRLKGATGSKFEPITEEQYKETISDDYKVAEYLQECEADRPDISSSYLSLAAQMGDYERENLFWDTSYRHLWGDIREQTGLSEKEAYIFNCIGGGKIFDKDYQGNINPELSEIIREIES